MKKLVFIFLLISQVTWSQSTYFIDTDRYRVMKIRVKNPTNITMARVYWATDVNPEFDPGRSLELSISANDESFKVYHVNLYEHPGWGDKQVTKMKIDDSSGTLKDSLEIEYIHLKETNLLWQDLRFSREEDGLPNSEQRKYYEPELMAQWEKTREVVDEILAPFPRVPGIHFGNLLNEAGIPAAINIPPLKGFSYMQTAIDRFINSGVKLEAINLQSTLSKPIDGIRPWDDEAEMQRRYDYVIDVVKWMRENYPGVKVGITCALFTKNHDYKKYYTELKNQLIEAGNHKIDFIELDHAQDYTDDFVGAGPGYNYRFWSTMKEYEQFLYKEMGVKFYAVIGMRWTDSPENYHYYTLQIPQLFRDWNIKCDGYVVQYWWKFPNREIPESDPRYYSACRTILGIFEDINYPHLSQIMDFPVTVTAKLPGTVPADSETFTLYPNPAKDRVNLRMNLRVRESDEKSEREIMITDLKGRIILFFDYYSLSEEVTELDRSTVSIDVSNFKPGMYLIRLDNQVKRFIKQ